MTLRSRGHARLRIPPAPWRRYSIGEDTITRPSQAAHKSGSISSRHRIAVSRCRSLVVRRNPPATRNAADGTSFLHPHRTEMHRTRHASPLPSMTAQHRARARCRIGPTTAEPLAAPQSLKRRASLKGVRRKALGRLNISGPGAAARGLKPLLSRGGSRGGGDTGPRPARAAAAHAVDPLMQESPSDACLWPPRPIQHRERDYGKWLGLPNGSRPSRTKRHGADWGRARGNEEVPPEPPGWGARASRYGACCTLRPAPARRAGCTVAGDTRVRSQLPYNRCAVKRFRLQRASC